jgi:hypothetical protein
MLLQVLISVVVVCILILSTPVAGASETVSLLDDDSISHLVVDSSSLASTMALNMPQGQVKPMVAVGVETEYAVCKLGETAVQYTLTVSSTAGGSVTSPGEGIFTYGEGTEVELVVRGEEGYRFVNWTGAIATISCQCRSTTITMNGNYSIKANFEKRSSTTSSNTCFIATAAYGTPMAEEIQILREFRDEYLLTSPVGQAIVDLYYRVSPPIAEFITEHPSLKSIVKVGLLPAVVMSTVVVNTTVAEKAAIVGLLALVSVGVAIWANRRRGRVPEYI